LPKSRKSDMFQASESPVSKTAKMIEARIKSKTPNIAQRKTDHKSRNSILQQNKTADEKDLANDKYATKARRKTQTGTNKRSVNLEKYMTS